MGGYNPVFLNTSYILLPKLLDERTCGVAMYRIPRSNSSPGPVYAIPHEDRGSSELELLATFEMDTLGRSHPEVTFYAHPRLVISGTKPYTPHPDPDPETVTVTTPTSNWPLTDDKFSIYPNDEGSFIHLEYRLFISQAETLVSMYIPRAAFLRFIPSSSIIPSPSLPLAPLPSDHPSTRPIPWSQWAQPYVRLAPFTDYARTATDMFGSKRAFWQREKSTLIVVDFIIDTLREPDIDSSAVSGNKEQGRGEVDSDDPSGMIGAKGKFIGKSTGDRPTYVVQRSLDSIKRQERYVGQLLMDSRHIVLCTVRFIYPSFGIHLRY